MLSSSSTVIDWTDVRSATVTVTTFHEASGTLLFVYKLSSGYFLRGYTTTTSLTASSVLISLTEGAVAVFIDAARSIAVVVGTAGNVYTYIYSSTSLTLSKTTLVYSAAVYKAYIDVYQGVVHMFYSNFYYAIYSYVADSLNKLSNLQQLNLDFGLGSNLYDSAIIVLTNQV